MRSRRKNKTKKVESYFVSRWYIFEINRDAKERHQLALVGPDDWWSKGGTSKGEKNCQANNYHIYTNSWK
jgi:hypothetical protein